MSTCGSARGIAQISGPALARRAQVGRACHAAVQGELQSRAREALSAGGNDPRIQRGRRPTYGMTGRPPSAAPFAIGANRASRRHRRDGGRYRGGRGDGGHGFRKKHAAAATGGVSRRPSVPVLHRGRSHPAPSCSRAGSSIRGSTPRRREKDGRWRTETARIAASSDIRFSSSVVHRLPSLVRHSSPVVRPLSSGRHDVGDEGGGRLVTD